MKAFEWASASNVEEAVKLLSAAADPQGDPDESPRPIGGGQDLHTTLKSYITRPSRVVNLKTISGMNGIELTADKSLKIGALATLTELEEHPDVRANFPGLSQAAHSIATPQIRNLGTVGGNLCQRPRCWYYRLENVKCLKKGGSTCYAQSGENKYNAIFGGGPSFIVHPSDLAPMLLALGAVLTVAGPAGTRALPLDQFFVLPKENLRRENVLKDGEIITEITVPPSGAASRSTYLKFKERASLDFAMSSVAAAVELGGDGTVKSARLVLGGVAPIPWHVPKVEAYMVGKKLDESTVGTAAAAAVEGAKPLAHNGYKVPLTSALVRRALLALA